MNKSLYGQYIAERENAHILECSEGFATYTYIDKYCYIKDIYVIPEHRKSNIASSLADQIAQIAKSNGYSLLMGSVDINANEPTRSLQVLLAYGFKVLMLKESMIYLSKEI